MMWPRVFIYSRTRNLEKSSQGRTLNQTQDPDAHLGNLQAPKPLETQRERGGRSPRPASSPAGAPSRG